MANQTKLTAKTRTDVGRSAVNKIKKEGRVPAVIYGGYGKPVTLSLDKREIANLLAHAVSEHVLVDLTIADGAQVTSSLALIQEVQHHPLKGDVLHVDFHAVRADETLHAEVPVEPFGEPEGVKNAGGILEIAVHSLEVECLPKDLPEIIRIDVSALNLGESIHVKDIQFPDGVTATADGDLTVVRVAAPKVEVEAVVEAVVAAEPEVIKEKKEEPAAAAPGKPAAEKTEKK
jgi:large subunit ribosomal protein L25